MTTKVIHGDCREVLAGMPSESVDAIVTDPPYEISFMNSGWDGSGIAYSVELWAECLRVLKPGGHLLAFGAARTYHRVACAIEDAGFEFRDSIHWVTGQGFPKSLDVSKAIDKAAGTTPTTDAAKQWSGWGTALKPSHEPIVVARKPLEGTVAANVLAHGTGALNIDGTRVGNAEVTINAFDTGAKHFGGAAGEPYTSRIVVGRWPANVVFTHAADCEQVDTTDDAFGGGANATSGFVSGYESGDGFVGQSVTVPVWRCADGCPVAELDGQSGVGSSGMMRAGTKTQRYDGPSMGEWKPREVRTDTYGDTGGASRFFTVTEWDPIADVAPFRYVPKPSKKERNADGTVTNGHPTVKPVNLLRWLVRLVTPPGGVVLDPFAGSGTTLVAAVLEGFDSIGVELTDDYLPIIEGRIEWAEAEVVKGSQELTLFDDFEADA